MGPKNTNTPPSGNPLGATPSPTPSTPTPTQGTTPPQGTPSSAPTQNSAAPAFSGSAPTINPFAGQNIIPSSATGDIILKPDKADKKPKKGLIIAIIIGIIFIAGLSTAAVLLTRPSASQVPNTSSSAPSEVTSISDLKTVFYTLSNYLISGADSANQPNFSITIDNWQLAKVASSSTSEIQASYASHLMQLQEEYSEYAKNYFEQFNKEESNADISTFQSDTQSLSDQVLAVVLFLRGEKFIENLSITYENSPEESKYYTVYELDTYGNVSDDLSEDLVGQIALYYNEFIKLERDEIRLKTYAADANQAFDTLLAELPKTIASVRAGIGEEEND